MIESEMLEDEIAIQKNVEKDLFDEQGKILDRFHSLITLTLTVAGFTFTFLSICSVEIVLKSRRLFFPIMSLLVFYVYLQLFYSQLLMC